MKPVVKRGRPSKYTPQIVEAICSSVRLGMTYKDAVLVAGISQDTFSQWQKQYPEFSEAIQRATAMGISLRLAAIIKAGEEDWRASAWWLEHVHPEKFAKNRIDVVHQGSVTQNFVIPPDLLVQIATVRAKYESGLN